MQISWYTPFIPCEIESLRLIVFSQGWSYGLNGKLAKAPRFDEIPDFEKDENGLFAVHVHVDQRGFVWVNLDASESPIPWNEDFLGADTEQRLQDFNMDEYAFDHTWSMPGEYNWKALIDNYNEVWLTQRTLLSRPI